MTLRNTTSAQRYPSWFASPPSLSSSTKAFDGFSRPSAREIQATIAAVENAPESDYDDDSYYDDDNGGERENQEGKEVAVSSAWLHSNAFEILAVRNSNNAGWDQRMTSREVMAEIKALEEHEREEENQQQEAEREFDRGGGSMVSGLSQPPLANVSVKTPPVANVSIKAPSLGQPATALGETPEERKRRERAEARARKIEAIADKRHVGEDDAASAVSGMSKRHRMRRKKKAVAALAAMEERGTSAPVRAETEAERRRKQRAEARAKKVEAMFDQRNEEAVGGGDDASTVTGISRRHRLRRKKSALAAAAISPQERERNDWKEGVYASALGAERSKWKRAVYGHALDAEAARARNLAAKRGLEEQDAAARRRLEKRRIVEERAKKVAARARRMDQLRHGRYGPEEDDDGSVAGSVVSAASRHRRRRRGGRRSSVRVGVPPVGEEAAAPVAPTPEQKESAARERWCASVYASALDAECSRWKNKVYSQALGAEESKKGRLEAEARVASIEARRAKERRDKRRAEKAERMLHDRGAAGMENTALYEDPALEAGGGARQGSVSSLKKFRQRRMEAAKRKSAH